MQDHQFSTLISQLTLPFFSFKAQGQLLLRDITAFQQLAFPQQICYNLKFKSVPLGVLKGMGCGLGLGGRYKLSSRTVTNDSKNFLVPERFQQSYITGGQLTLIENQFFSREEEMEYEQQCTVEAWGGSEANDFLMCLQGRFHVWKTVAKKKIGFRSEK